MRLSPSGHPLHTRSQTIDIRRDDDDRVVGAATHLDLRKRGFVPVGCDLQGSGIIHHMSVTGAIDVAKRRLLDVEVAMPTVAFEPSSLTRGETCRQVAGAQPELEELPLDGRSGKAVGAAMGGVRGCSHVLAVTQHFTSATAHALAEADRSGLDWARGRGRRLFLRSLNIDGLEPEEGRIDLAVELSDLWFREAGDLCNPMDIFSHQHEVRLYARTERGTNALAAIEVAERRRDRGTLEDEWQRRDETVAELRGAPFIGGFAREVLQRFADPGRDQPLVDVLLALAPAYLQVCACFSETWPRRTMDSDSLVGIGGMPDACYMWRADGALQAQRRDSDPSPVG